MICLCGHTKTYHMGRPRRCDSPGCLCTAFVLNSGAAKRGTMAQAQRLTKAARPSVEVGYGGAELGGLVHGEVIVGTLLVAPHVALWLENAAQREGMTVRDVVANIVSRAWRDARDADDQERDEQAADQ